MLQLDATTKSFHRSILIGSTVTEGLPLIIIFDLGFSTYHAQIISIRKVLGKPFKSLIFGIQFPHQTL
jgi:hypothetical protein